jgi:hypothetical protein
VGLNGRPDPGWPCVYTMGLQTYSHLCSSFSSFSSLSSLVENQWHYGVVYFFVHFFFSFGVLLLVDDAKPSFCIWTAQEVYS